MEEVSLFDFIDGEDVTVEVTPNIPVPHAPQPHSQLNYIRNRLWLCYKMMYQFYSLPMIEPSSKCKNWLNREKERFGDIRKNNEEVKEWFRNLTIVQLSELLTELEDVMTSWSGYTYRTVEIKRMIEKLLEDYENS